MILTSIYNCAVMVTLTSKANFSKLKCQNGICHSHWHSSIQYTLNHMKRKRTLKKSSITNECYTLKGHTDRHPLSPYGIGLFLLFDILFNSLLISLFSFIFCLAPDTSPLLVSLFITSHQLSCVSLFAPLDIPQSLKSSFIRHGCWSMLLLLDDLY